MHVKSFLIPIVFVMSACTPNQTTIQSVNVEETELNDVGVVLDEIEAVTYTSTVDENIYSTRVDSVANESLPQSRVVAFAQPSETPQKSALYFIVSNKDLLDSLKLKLGASFYKKLDIYQSAVSNQKPIDQFPELGVIYKFKAKVNSTHTEDICFKLSDAFAGFGVIIQMRENLVNDYSGVGKMLFETPNLSIFKIGSSSHFAVKLESGGKFYGLSLSSKTFKLSPLSVSLPVVSRTVKVVGQRVSPALVSKMGASVTLNGALFYYVDSKSSISHIYFMNSNFVIKDIVSHCPSLASSGMLPEGLSCSSPINDDPAVAADPSVLNEAKAF